MFCCTITILDPAEGLSLEKEQFCGTLMHPRGCVAISINASDTMRIHLCFADTRDGRVRYP